MSSLHSKQNKFWRYGAIALISLLITLGFGDRLWLNLKFLYSQTAIAQPAPSAAFSPDLLVQQGVTLYEAGNFQAAIEHWNIALERYNQTEEYSKAAIVLENLVVRHRDYDNLGVG